MAVAQRLVRGRVPNAALGWAQLLRVVALAAVLTLGGNLLWAALALFSIAAVAVPILAMRDATAIVPWPVVSLLLLAVGLRTLGLYAELAGYLAVSGLALVAVVEIDATTSVETSRRFAVFSPCSRRWPSSPDGPSPSSTPTAFWVPPSSPPRPNSSGTSSP